MIDALLWLAAEPVCAPRDAVTAKLERQFGETPVSAGLADGNGGIFSIYANDDRQRRHRDVDGGAAPRRRLRLPDRQRIELGRDARGSEGRADMTTNGKSRFQNGRPCHWCKRQMAAGDRYLTPTRDHVEPRSRGGASEIRNIVWACAACNNLKGDMSLAAWYALMNQVPSWWLFAEKQGPRGVDLHLAMVEDGFSMPPIKRIVTGLVFEGEPT